MSLLDTIKQAKEEAIQAGTLPSPQQKKEKTPKNDKNAPERHGALRSSLTRAKPTREKAKGVTNSSHKTQPSVLKPSAAREARRRERDERDRRYAVTRVLIAQNPEYSHYQNVLWLMLGAGLVSIALSWLLNYLRPEAMSDLASPEGMLEVVLLVLAYVFVIAGFIYDLRKAKPLRRAAEERAASLSPKKMRELLLSDQAKDADNGSILAKFLNIFRRK